MGSTFTKVHYDQQDYNTFSQRLNDEVELIKQVIQQPDFDTDPLQIGAELEMYLANKQGQVSCNSIQLLDSLNDPQFQTEFNQYNIELNLSSVLAAGTPFTRLLNEMREKIAILDEVAARQGIDVVPIGILPTLKEAHLQRDHMTKLPRYQFLSNQLLRCRGEAFSVNINGEEPVSLSCDDASVEGANTSFQVHLMVEQGRFADVFNAAQLTSPLALALAANSGVLLGNRVWDETRIALFKQSLDVRCRGRAQWQQPTRVTFGFGWVRKDASELFAETVSLFEPLIPLMADEDPHQAWAAGQLPGFKELSLHMGTTWPWHRPVYSSEGKGHVRIEFRALPAGPSSIDMVANAAFSIGLAVGLADDIDDYLKRIPFRYAEYNFYRAAQWGMDARILWPQPGHQYLQEVPILTVIGQLFDVATKGLRKLSVSETEISRFLGVIEQRMVRRINGAQWQKKTLIQLEKHYNKEQACQQLLKQYMTNVRSAKPVAQWE